MITVVDYGMGNLRSMQDAISYLGFKSRIGSTTEDIDRATALVLPGVGAFGDAISVLRKMGLFSALNSKISTDRVPLLGVCLGMQLPASESFEHGLNKGFGWIDAKVIRLNPEKNFKVPHVGWNSVVFREDDWLFRGIDAKESHFYFTHSFHLVCRCPEDVIATVDYGGSMTVAVRRDNVNLVQFHPEKSQDNGLRLLQNWIEHIDQC